jgi:GAF domain-containing protein
MNPSADHPSSEFAEMRRRLAELEALEAEHARAAKVQAALYRIAELAGAACDLQEFYRAIHGVVGELMNATNFFIALYDEERRLISWPYSADEVDTDVPDPNRWEEFGTGDGRGVTAYVLRTGSPQHISRERLEELLDLGEIDLVGTGGVSEDWLGVPLKSDDQRTVGVLVVQSYRHNVRYTEQNEELLTFVGQHVGAALSRARAIEETRQRNAQRGRSRRPDPRSEGHHARPQTRPGRSAVGRGGRSRRGHDRRRQQGHARSTAPQVGQRAEPDLA